MPLPNYIGVLLVEHPRQNHLSLVLLLLVLNLAGPKTSLPAKGRDATRSRNSSASEKQDVIVLHHPSHCLLRRNVLRKVEVGLPFNFPVLAIDNFSGSDMPATHLSASFCRASSYYFLKVSIFVLVSLMSLSVPLTPFSVSAILFWV